MDKKLIQQIKKQLLETRETLLKSFKKTFELSEKEVGDTIDNAFDSSEREATFEATNHDRNTLNEVENALKKIEEGAFGICEECKKTISEPRLKVLPSTRFCIDCQEKFENKK